MNWYKKAVVQINNYVAEYLTSLNTINKSDVIEANKTIIEVIGIEVNDILISKTMSTGQDKNYKVESINPDFSVNLLAMETQRKMPNVNLYDPAIKNVGGRKRKNLPRWEKI